MNSESMDNAKEHLTNHPSVVNSTVHVQLDELVQFIWFSKILNQNRKKNVFENAMLKTSV